MAGQLFPPLGPLGGRPVSTCASPPHQSYQASVSPPQWGAPTIPGGIPGASEALPSSIQVGSLPRRPSGFNMGEKEDEWQGGASRAGGRQEQLMSPVPELEGRALPWLSWVFLGLRGSRVT